MTRGEVMMGICIHGAELWERWVRGNFVSKIDTRGGNNNGTKWAIQGK
jgi:hypothetical protein